MSHFSVLVVTDKEPTHEVLAEILQPWHEFESTGVDDQYVQDIDQTEDAKADYERHKDDPDYPTFRKFVDDYYGKKPVFHDEKPDLAGEHKYGYAQLNEKAEVVKVIDRTNPNRKWDWWVVGGRYRGKLKTKQPALVTRSEKHWSEDRDDVPQGFGDSAKVSDLDWEGMRQATIERNKKWIENALQECQYKGTNFTREQLLEIWKTCAEYDEDIQRFTEEWKEAGYPREGDGWKDAFMRKQHPDHPATKAFSDAVASGLVGSFRGLSEFVPTNEPDPFKWAESLPAFTAFAAVKDGEWLEEGNMGWFACVSNENKDFDQQFRALLDSLKPEQYVTVVDCHI